MLGHAKPTNVTSSLRQNSKFEENHRRFIIFAKKLGGLGDLNPRSPLPRMCPASFATYIMHSAIVSGVLSDTFEGFRLPYCFKKAFVVDHA